MKVDAWPILLVWNAWLVLILHVVLVPDNLPHLDRPGISFGDPAESTHHVHVEGVQVHVGVLLLEHGEEELEVVTLDCVPGAEEG